MTPRLVRRSPMTNVLGSIRHAEAVAAQDHSGIIPLLGASSSVIACCMPALFCANQCLTAAEKVSVDMAVMADQAPASKLVSWRSRL